MPPSPLRTGWRAAAGLGLLIVTFLIGFYARAVLDRYTTLRLPEPGGDAAPNYSLLTEITNLLRSRYIATLPDEQALEYGAAHGLVSAVGDPYTVFVEPPAHELESQSLSGEYGGVGMNVTQNADGAFVVDPFFGSPAEQAGIVKGDLLLAVDEVPLTRTLTLDEVVARVRGPLGSSVTLQVQHAAGDVVTVTIERQRIELPSVTGRLADGQPTIGVIAISRFSGQTEAELKRALNELQAQGATRYVLDLRNNGGGLLEAGIAVAAQFLDGGVVMYESQRDAPEKVYSVPANSGPATTAPLAVLVNKGTASASEIVAGALLDRERAPLIGQATYGKGSVQLVYDLSDGSSLHVTAYRWYTPARREIDQVGLPPTLPVEPAADGSDAELARAIEYVMSQP